MINMFKSIFKKKYGDIKMIDSFEEVISEKSFNTYNNVLLTFALYEEAKYFINYNFKGIDPILLGNNSLIKLYRKDNLNLLITGLGSVNVLNSLYKVINLVKEPLDCIINMGTCGSNTAEHIVKFNIIKQDGLDSFKEYSPSFRLNNGNVIIANDDSIDTRDDNILNTVSVFKENIDSDKRLFFDMEAYSIASFCYNNNIKLEVFKNISDSGDLDDFKKSIDKCSYDMCQFLNHYLYGKNQN